MKLKPYQEVIRMAKEVVDAALVPVKVIKAKKRLQFLMADVDERIAEQESKIETMCLEKEIDFNLLAILQDELALMERRKKQFTKIMGNVSMSYQHTQRRKTVKRFKEKFGEKKWWTEFIGHTCKCRRERLGPPIGTLEEIVGAARTQGRGMFRKERV